MMSHRRWQLSRRRLLRGGGAALALPLLNAMQPVAKSWADPAAIDTAAKTSAAAATAAASPYPTRMAFLFFPNGVWRDAWIPQQTGNAFALPASLEPLAPHQSECLVFSGLDKAHSHTGDGHYAKTANFLTGLHVTKTTGKDINCGGISVDQLMAKHVGRHTPLPSLELGIDPVISGIDSLVGFTRLYGSNISWETATRPVAKEINPRIVYERLFGLQKQATQAGQLTQEQDDYRSLLDAAFEDARRLRGQLGRDDQFKLDEYLDAVRSVERRVEFFGRADGRAWQATPGWENQPVPAQGIPHDYREHVKLMLDMMVLAFWTDSTRVLSFMFANDVSNRNFSFIDGVSGSHHELSHHERRAEKIEQYRRINRWHVEQFAYLIGRLREIREGEGTLLDHSAILLGCGMSDGNEHNPANLPILLAGRAGGTITPGRHLASAAGTPLCNLYLSLLESMQINSESFGDSNGALPIG